MKPKQKRFHKRQLVRVARYERKQKRYRQLARAKELAKRKDMAVKLITPNEFLGIPDAPVTPPQSTPTEAKVQQATAQPVKPEEHYHGFKEEVKTGEQTSVALTTNEQTSPTQP